MFLDPALISTAQARLSAVQQCLDCISGHFLCYFCHHIWLICFNEKQILLVYLIQYTNYCCHIHPHHCCVVAVMVITSSWLWSLSSHRHSHGHHIALLQSQSSHHIVAVAGRRVVVVIAIIASSRSLHHCGHGRSRCVITVMIITSSRHCSRGHGHRIVMSWSQSSYPHHVMVVLVRRDQCSK